MCAEAEAKAREKQAGTHYKRGGTTSSEAARVCPASADIKACLNCKRRRCVFDVIDKEAK